MKYPAFLLRGAALSALLIVSTSPAFAQSREDRARVAIAEAHAKIDAANKTGASGEVPTLVARAEAALRSAEEQFHRDHNATAIEDAHQASMLADQALGIAEKNKSADAQVERDQRASAEAAASAAQANAESERAQRENAEAATVAAQATAADATARAASAEQSAAASASDAAAARAAAVAAQTQPSVTEVTTTTTAPTTRSYSVKKKTTVRRTTAKKPAVKASTSATTTTTTTVKTQ
jgi:SWI/SNF-related matrix-associated actin-dependent regulator 1 of chromatin subfamily A